ncbi:hypothetical protein CW751_02405 [Brumimicrobium salinarum]|uniref:Peptidase C14 caspase domain-containing protein n=1 Tax=Brumimicrobium salinarum TaxID=2058658 RepID=A0A2I0R6I6_9FLAO|nr:caspase family protein [Brumimicrobium salinarum]PKR82203.1 hypothetical protein CW751_02405 [Brumimicrobium salinarum]
MKSIFFIFFLTAFVSSVFAQEAELITQQRIRSTITNFKFSPDGQYLANSSKDDPSIHVWHLASNKIIGSLQGYENTVNTFSFNTSGDEMISIHEDATIIRWDLETWSIADSITLPHTSDFVLFKGNSILVEQNGRISVYDRALKKQKDISISGKVISGKSIANLAYLGSNNGQLTLFNWKTSEVKQQKTFSKIDFQHMDIHEDLIMVLNNNGSVSEISRQALSLGKTFQPIRGLFFGTRYGKVMAKEGLVAYITNQNEISIYNRAGNLTTQLLDTIAAEKIQVMEFSPNGNILATSSFKEFQIKNNLSENSIKIWDVQRKGLISELKGSVNPVRSFSFHPEKNWVAILGEHTSLSLWDMDYAEKIMDFELKEPQLEQKINLISDEEAKDISPFKLNKLKDKLVSSTVRRTVNRGIRKQPVLVKFSANGNYLITKLEKDEVRIYNLKDKKLTYAFYAEHQQERINDFITDPDEKYLICLGAGDKAVSVVELSTGKLIRKLETKNQDASYEFLNNAISVAYHPKGENFSVCTGRGQLFIWDKNFKSEFKTSGSNIFRAGNNAFVTYSKNGKVIYLKGMDGIRGYSVDGFHVSGTNKLKMTGTPHSLGTPQDYMVGFEKNKGYIEHLKTKDIIEFDIHSNLINDVDASLRNYIGIALKNGEFRIIDARSGELLATFIGEGENTIIKTEDNFYKVNKEGFDLVSFRVGQKAYPFEQFDAYYNRPDLVLKALKCPDDAYIDLYQKAHSRRMKKLNLTDTETPNFSTLPQLSITNKKDLPYTQKAKNVNLKLEGSTENSSLKTLKITINNVPIINQSISGKTYTEEIQLELIRGVNKINVYLIDNKDQESLAESISINCTREDAPNLYLVTVGTSEYKDSRFSLNYAAKDAKDLNSLFTEQNNRSIYNEVNTYILTNEEVKKEAFDDLKSFLKKAGRNDQVVFYIAGHGVLDEQYAYYYGTYDINFLQPGTRGLAYANLEDILSGISAVKKLLIMDTCHSGEVSEDEVVLAENDEGEDLAFEDVTFRAVGPKLREGTDTKASAGKMARVLFADIRKGTGATVISSAGGVEFAMEGEDWKNGLFTYCLLNGLTNRTADKNGDGVIMLSELQKHLISQVDKLSHGKQVPTTRVQNIRLDYPIW